MITTWVITIATLFIGFGLGYVTRKPEETRKSAQRLARKAKRKVAGQKIGAIQNLTKTQQDIRGNPTLRAEEEEMERVLESVL